jgi:glycosyltransferase involved in cell wall biosynthesis
MTDVQAAKKVLIIAYIFPPIGGSGVQRTLKFVKYLPQLGWQPIVVCGDDGHICGDSMDPSLPKDVPEGVPVYRRPFVSAYGLRRWAKRKLGFARTGQQPTFQSEQDQVIVPVELQASLPEGAEKPISRRILGTIAKIMEPIEKPLIDAATYWALSIVPLCRRLVTEHNVDVIFSTSFPYSDHLTGLLTKKLTGRPWVADFRDPWTLNACFQHTGFRRRVDMFVERQVLYQADKIVAATPLYTQNFRELAPDRAASDFVTITNGYDETDFQVLTDQGASMSVPWRDSGGGKITIAHVGYVFPGSAIPFLLALAHLGDVAHRLRVVFIGGLAVPDMRWLQDHPVPVEIQFTARVPHAQAIHSMQSADAVLLLIGDGPDWLGHYPGKLFEYTRCGTPILLSGPNGASAQLVRESGTGCTVPANDIEGTAEAIRLLATDPVAFRALYYSPVPEVITRYERRTLTRQLALLFNELVGDAQVTELMKQHGT